MDFLHQRYALLAECKGAATLVLEVCIKYLIDYFTTAVHRYCNRYAQRNNRHILQ